MAGCIHSIWQDNLSKINRWINKPSVYVCLSFKPISAYFFSRFILAYTWRISYIFRFPLIERRRCAELPDTLCDHWYQAECPVLFHHQTFHSHLDVIKTSEGKTDWMAFKLEWWTAQNLKKKIFLCTHTVMLDWGEKTSYETFFNNIMIRVMRVCKHHTTFHHIPTIDATLQWNSKNP